MRIILLTISILLMHVIAGLAAEHTKDTPAVIKANLANKKAVIMDVREQEEREEGVLAGAIHVPHSQIEAAAADSAALKRLGEALASKIFAKTIVYTHCASGYRSRKAATVLEKLGYEVRPLKAGYQQLVGQGFPKSEPPAK